MATVLVVDDDAGIRESAAMALAKVGHRIHQASDAYEAQRVLREHRVDVVVSDIYMPGENGLELLQAIAERPGAPRVILMTARGSIETTSAGVDTDTVTPVTTVICIVSSPQRPLASHARTIIVCVPAVRSVRLAVIEFTWPPSNLLTLSM